MYPVISALDNPCRIWLPTILAVNTDALAVNVTDEPDMVLGVMLRQSTIISGAAINEKADSLPFTSGAK